MIRVRALFAPAAVLALSGLMLAQEGPLGRSWPTYNGDLSGRRFSSLTEINDKNINSLQLAWTYKVDTGEPGSNIPSGTPLMSDGVIYLSTQDHAFAIDAHTGKEVWTYTWPSKGARHFSNRGMGMFGNFVYFETPDCNLVALNKTDGTLRWSKTFADIDQYYYCSVAPVVVGNHVIVGTSGDDLDIAGYIEAHDPETGAVQWRFYTVPQKKGDTGMDTWPNADMASHGGGMTWQPITYDPALRLIYVTTGNPQPVIANVNRKGANLFTASVVAVHADTGKLAWWFQTSPHDTHDWDSTQAAVLFDGTIAGQSRKLLGIAARNGHFFVLDRQTGKAYVHTEFVKTNWSLGYDAKGQPIPNPQKFPSVAGALVSPNQGGATNWFPPTFSPKTGLFYVSANHAFSVYYLYDDSENPQGWGGNDRSGWSESMVQAIDYKTGKIKWSHPWESGNNSGLLSTAGNVLFTGAPGSYFEALNAETGEALWHSKLQAPVRVPPSTWELDGKQYVLVGAANTLYAFTLAK